MKKINTVILSSLLGGAILFGATSAYSQRVPGMVSTPTDNPSVQQPDDSEDLAFRICFYTKSNYQDMAFCRWAPSRVGVLSSELQDNIRSIKITDNLGRQIKSPLIKLKICDKIWRQGNCEIFNGSQKHLAKIWGGPVISFSFDARS